MRERLRRRAFVVGFVALGSVWLGAQAVQQPAPQTPPPPKGTGILMGQVVDAQDKRAISGALVSLAGEVPVPQAAASATDAPRQILTDGSGRFMFRSVAAGRYQVRATAGSYIAAGLNQNRPTGTSQFVELTTDDEKRDGLLVKMWKSASISGIVTDEAGEPVIGYSVRLLRRTATSRGIRYSTANSGTTDDRGFYRMSGLAPGEYVVAMLSSQSTMPASTVDEYYREMMSGGSSLNSQLYRELSSSGASPSMGSGGYRLGEFIVTAGTLGRSGGPPPPSPTDEGRMMTYLNQYFPSASVISQASVLSLAAGEERPNTDLRLRLVPAMRVSGSITGPDGPVRNMGVRLVPLGIDDISGGDSMDIATSASDAAGNFTMFGVPPGTYLLRATRIPRPSPTLSRNMTTVEVSGPNGMIMGMSTSTGSANSAPLPTDPTLSGQAQVTVGSSDLNGVNLVLRTGPRISGRLVFEGTKAQPTPDVIQQTSISISPMSGTMVIQFLTAPKKIEPDGRFSTVGYPAGRYLISAAPSSQPGQPTPWRMKSAIRAGRDVADEGLELDAEDITDVVITFTDQTSDISGAVTDVKGQPDVGALVIAFPADSDSWRQGNPNARRIRSARTTTTGTYSLTLPAGAYYLAALSDESADNWQDPVKLEAVMRGGATRVTLADGQKLTQALTTRTAR